MSRKLFAILGFITLGLLVTALVLKNRPEATDISTSTTTSLQVASPAPPMQQVAPAQNVPTTKEVPIEENSSFYTTLVKESIPPQTVLQIAHAAKRQFDLSELSPGTRLVLGWSHEKLESLRVLLSGIKELHVQSKDGDWHASLIEHEVKIELTAFFGEIKDTLWESAVSVGMPFDLISDLSDIFASQVDFTRELNVGDQWSFLIEKKMVGQQEVGFGDILAAEISKRGENLPAFRFVVDGHKKYFDAEGQSNRGKFLKSPLRYNKVTSRFQNARFHPILKSRRPHRGVDLSASTGTPVRSVGDGSILEAGRNGGSGIMVKIRHDSRYMTAYKHLSKVASGVRSGSKVEQGQIIGYVGQTGLATGPHLHFEFYEDGRYVDPMGKRFPRRDSVEPRNRARFNEEVKRLSEILEEFRKKSKAF